MDNKPQTQMNETNSTEHKHPVIHAENKSRAVAGLEHCDRIPA